MRNPKLILVIVLVASILVLVVSILALAPSRVKAQGLIEYSVYACIGDLGLFPIPPTPEGEALKEYLEEWFGIEWQNNYGIFVDCKPKFDKKAGLDKIDICFIVYSNEDDNERLTPGDTKQSEFCDTLKYP